MNEDVISVTPCIMNLTSESVSRLPFHIWVFTEVVDFVIDLGWGPRIIRKSRIFVLGNFAE